MKLRHTLAALGRMIGARCGRWLRPPQEAPVERPPRSRAHHTRTHVVWNADQMHPYSFSVDEPDRDGFWTR